ncbi:WD repeat-containing protein, putative [Plasmodium vinckei]|uniref:WD repeat-containing protein, putative n=1 Tax=Plasmodium vinckei TaxID=5860 RepID=A0A6V7SWF8_PLAVN|nr:WD repeat-containing protein, putative [Plasmodium vinckei]
MGIRNWVSSDDYVFEIKNNESLFENKKLEYNVKPVWSFKGHTNSVEGIHIIDKNRFVTTSHDSTISLWSFEYKNQIKNINLYNPILCSSYNSKEKNLCVGTTNNNENIYLINIKQIEEEKIEKKVSKKNIEEKKNIEIYSSNCGSIFCINYFEDDKISYGSKDGCICLLDLNNKKNIYKYNEIEEDCQNFCTYSENYKFHIFSTYKGKIIFIDSRQQNGPIYINDSLHSNYSINTIFNCNNYIYTGGSDCLIKKFDIRCLEKSQPVEIYVGHTSPIRSLAFSKKYSNFFCSSSDSGSIKLWKCDKSFSNTNKIAASLSCTASVFDNTNQVLSIKRDGSKIRKPSKNFLELNKINVSNNRSSSIISEEDNKKISESAKLLNKSSNYNISPNKVIGSEKFSKKGTGSDVKINNDHYVQVISKQELFNSVKNKPDGVNKLSRNRNLKSENKLSNASSINPNIIYKSNNFNTNSKMTEKNYLNTLSDNNRNGIASSTKTNNNILNSNFFSNETCALNNTQKTIKITYPNLSMVNHKSRVSSMEWTNNFILSTSWDQTVKCWDVRNYVTKQ